jgi:hypothetical protein
MTCISHEAMLARVLQDVHEHVLAGFRSSASCTISRCRRTGSSCSDEEVRILVFVDWALFLTVFISGTGYAASALAEISKKGVAVWE